MTEPLPEAETKPASAPTTVAPFARPRDLFIVQIAPEMAPVAKVGGLADVVMSDMAASASGHKQTDHNRIIALCEAAAYLAFDVLTPGGTFVAKVLSGGAEGDLQKILKQKFSKVENVKQPASRSDSS